MGQTAGKAARSVLGKGIGSFGTPDIILADNGAIFAGGGISFSAPVATSLHRQLFLDIEKA